MCDHDNREAAMTVISRDDDGTPTVWCDPCLAPLIRALNDGGLPTAASCCGHNGNGSDGDQTDAPGWIMLRDGRTLTIAAPTPERDALRERVEALAERYAEYGAQREAAGRPAWPNNVARDLRAALAADRRTDRA